VGEGLVAGHPTPLEVEQGGLGRQVEQAGDLGVGDDLEGEHLAALGQPGGLDRGVQGVEGAERLLDQCRVGDRGWAAP